MLRTVRNGKEKIGVEACRWVGLESQKKRKGIDKKRSRVVQKSQRKEKVEC